MSQKMERISSAVGHLSVTKKKKISSNIVFSKCDKDGSLISQLE